MKKIMKNNDFDGSLKSGKGSHDLISTTNSKI